MIDVMKLTAQMVDKVELDPNEDTCTVKFIIPTDVGQLSYEETFYWSKTQPAPVMKEEVADFVKLLVEETKKKRVKEDGILCDTCSQRCCRHFDTIRVTREDVIRLERAGHDIGKCVTFWDDSSKDKPARSMDNTVGYMTKKPWKGYAAEADEKMGCVFVTNRGCSIYKDRPQVCRDFTPYNCDVYEKDPTKKNGKVKLLVAR